MQQKLTGIKLTVILIVLFSLPIISNAQPAGSEKKYSATALKEDLAFVKRQLFNAHANPFTEISQQQYEKLFNEIESRITDSLTAIDFYKLVKPVMAWLSDEHADISLPKGWQVYDENETLLPFTLKADGKKYIIDAVIVPGSGIESGAVVKQINHIDIAAQVNRCATYATGFPQQRIDKALRYFGYLYGLANKTAATYTITLAGGRQVTVAGAKAAAWRNYINSNRETQGRCDKMISYTRYGSTGYINACSFSTHSDSEFNVVADTIKAIYKQIQADSIKTLLIDVSNNGGGNSSVGNVLIDGFYSKPYRSYQCNWKRSDEYLNLIKSWGVTNDEYAQKKPGDVIHYDSDTTWPGSDIAKFNGKVYVIVGDDTFSSAIMFATIVNDNKMATLIGQTPRNGHPTHFGELYNTTIPNTKLPMRFGVKEWIRPAGKDKYNTLTPGVLMPVSSPLNVQDVISRVNSLQVGK